MAGYSLDLSTYFIMAYLEFNLYTPHGHRQYEDSE